MNAFIDAATADIVVRAGLLVGGYILIGIAAVIGTLLWGRGGRKRLVESNKRLEAETITMNERLAALEAEARVPAITQSFNFHDGATAEERDRHLRGAVDAATTRGIKEAIERLPRVPLAGGHAYVRLPDGTNIVLMANGRMLLALPIEVSASFEGGLKGDVSASVSLGPSPAPREQGGDD